MRVPVTKQAGASVRVDVEPATKVNWPDAIEPSSFSVSKPVEPALNITLVVVVPLLTAVLDEKVVAVWARPLSEIVSPAVNPPIRGNSAARPASPLIVHCAPESYVQRREMGELTAGRRQNPGVRGRAELHCRVGSTADCADEHAARPIDDAVPGHA